MNMKCPLKLYLAHLTYCSYIGMYVTPEICNMLPAYYLVKLNVIFCLTLLRELVCFHFNEVFENETIDTIVIFCVTRKILV